MKPETVYVIYGYDMILRKITEIRGVYRNELEAFDMCSNLQNVNSLELEPNHIHYDYYERVLH